MYNPFASCANEVTGSSGGPITVVGDGGSFTTCPTHHLLHMDTDSRTNTTKKSDNETKEHPSLDDKEKSNTDDVRSLLSSEMTSRSSVRICIIPQCPSIRTRPPVAYRKVERWSRISERSENLRRRAPAQGQALMPLVTSSRTETKAREGKHA